VAKATSDISVVFAGFPRQVETSCSLCCSDNVHLHIPCGIDCALHCCALSKTVAVRSNLWSDSATAEATIPVKRFFKSAWCRWLSVLLGFMEHRNRLMLVNSVASHHSAQ
jgi:hypothetical protein